LAPQCRIACLRIPKSQIAAQQKKGDQLLRQLIACSPKVTAQEPGIFLLDASGLKYFGSEQKLCRDIQQAAGRAGFEMMSVGIADSAFAAMVASRVKNKQSHIVLSGQDAAFLAPLSIKHLPVDDEMKRSLLELGIKTMGQIKALPESSLAERFGRQGALAYQLAQGVDSRCPQLPVPAREFKCFADAGYATEHLQETQFLLKSMLDRLTKQMRQEGFWAEELLVSFFNDKDKFDERTIELLRPSNQAKFLLEVIKLSLAAKPLQREFTAVELSVSRFSEEGWHQTKIPADAAPANGGSNGLLVAEPPSLVLMLQRFMTRLGENTIVRAVPEDQYIPEKAGDWVPVTAKKTAAPFLPVNISYAGAHAGVSGLTCGLALRRLQPPQSVLVEYKGESSATQKRSRANAAGTLIPKAITYHGRWHTIKEITLPERLSGLWWEQPVRKSYYIAMIEERELARMAAGTAENEVNCLLVLLVHDHEAKAWYLEGVFD
jgi:hypothetical protein